MYIKKWGQNILNLNALASLIFEFSFHIIHKCNQNTYKTSLKRLTQYICSRQERLTMQLKGSSFESAMNNLNFLLISRNNYLNGSRSPSDNGGGSSVYDSDSMRSRCSERSRVTEAHFGIRRLMDDLGKYPYGAGAIFLHNQAPNL